MGWKDLPRWSRYGIYIAVIYPVIYHLLVLIASALEDSAGSVANILFYPIFILVLPAIPFGELFGVNYLIPTIVMVVVGFIIGAIIGRIVEKSKTE